MKRSILLASCLAAGAAFAAQPAATAVVTVDPAQALGPIKPMHAVNNGPTVKKPGGDQVRGNFEDYKAARIPLARTHDSINCVSGGAHTCDINAIFPNFDADENDPKNYDFVFTDHYLDNIRRTGTAVFFRLGQTIEHGPKKYGVLPPKDFGKWARICEHVIRHYNEGWGWGLDQEHTTKNVAWSNQFNIVYWEIWNEPDLDPSDNENALPANPRCWGGTATNFFRLFETTAKHLKGQFPNLKIGGPAIAGNFRLLLLAHLRHGTQADRRELPHGARPHGQVRLREGGIDPQRVELRQGLDRRLGVLARDGVRPLQPEGGGFHRLHDDRVPIRAA